MSVSLYCFNKIYFTWHNPLLCVYDSMFNPTMMSQINRLFSVIVSFLHLTAMSLHGNGSYEHTVMKHIVYELAKEIVFDRIGRIKAPDPWKGHTSTMSSGVHIHRSQLTVKPCPHINHSMGANWMFSGYLGI